MSPAELLKKIDDTIARTERDGKTARAHNDREGQAELNAEITTLRWVRHQVTQLAPNEATKKLEETVESLAYEVGQLTMALFSIRDRYKPETDAHQIAVRALGER